MLSHVAKSPAGLANEVVYLLMVQDPRDLLIERDDKGRLVRSFDRSLRVSAQGIPTFSDQGLLTDYRFLRKAIRTYARRILVLQREAAALLADPSGSRTLKVGLPDDLMTATMSQGFAHFAQRYREIRLDFTTGLSRDLSRQFRAGEFDVVIVKEPRAQADARASFPEPLAWIEATNQLQQWSEPIPLVAFPPGGLYRDPMIEQVEAAGLRWYLAFTGNSLVSVLRGVQVGLSVSILPGATIAPYPFQTCRQYEPVSQWPCRLTHGNRTPRQPRSCQL